MDPISAKRIQHSGRDKARQRVKFLPISVNMFGAVGIANVDESRIDHDVLLAAIEQVIEQT